MTTLPMKILEDNSRVKFPPLGEIEQTIIVIDRLKSVIDCQYFKKLLAETRGIILCVMNSKNNDTIFLRSINVVRENYDYCVHLLNEIFVCLDENLTNCETGIENRPITIKSLRGLIFIVVGADRECGLSLIHVLAVGIGLITEEKNS
jgi:hypothetical protein